MTDLTLTDRFFRGVARYLDRPALALIASQPLLRRLFAVTAPLGSALPRGATMIRKPDESLHIRPTGVARRAPILLYLHGGGFTIGSPRTHAALAGHLAAQAGLQAVLPRYRLAPEYPYPAAQEDVFAFYEGLVASGETPVALAGDSAGGCLALQLAMHARDTGLPLPKAMGLIAPVADVSGKFAARFTAASDEILIPQVWAERIQAAVFPGRDLDDPALSPLSGDLSGLPPTLIQASADEALAHDAERLTAALDLAERDLWPGLPHVWQIHAGRAPAADRAIVQMGTFLAEQIAAR